MLSPKKRDLLKPEISRECLCAESCPLIESGHAFPEKRVIKGSFINDVTYSLKSIEPLRFEFIH